MSKRNRVTSAVMADISGLQAGGPVRRRATERERRQAQSLCDRFCDRMESMQAFSTREEAIESLAPIAVWIIGLAARQFAIWVITRLWERWHNG